MSLKVHHYNNSIFIIQPVENKVESRVLDYKHSFLTFEMSLLLAIR